MSLQRIERKRRGIDFSMIKKAAIALAVVVLALAVLIVAYTAYKDAKAAAATTTTSTTSTSTSSSTTSVTIWTTTLVKTTTTTSTTTTTISECRKDADCGMGYEVRDCYLGNVYLYNTYYDCKNPGTSAAKCEMKMKMAGQSLVSGTRPLEYCEYGCVNATCLTRRQNT